MRKTMHIQPDEGLLCVAFYLLGVTSAFAVLWFQEGRER
jgi:hypothetical protein